MPEAQLLVRQAVRADLRSIMALYRQLQSEHSALSLERLETLFDSLGSYPDYHIYVAEAGGSIAGTFALLIMDTFGDRCAPAGIVEDVVVDRSLRGQGVGRAMMEYAMDRCRAAGCYKLVLSGNLRRHDAHRFYESMGFERHGFSFTVTL